MSRQTPHGAAKGDHIAAKGRNLISRIRKGHEGTPVYRKFNGQRFEGKSWVPVHTTATKKEAIAWAARYEKENPHVKGIIAPFPKGVSQANYATNGRTKRWVCYVQEWTVRRT